MDELPTDRLATTDSVGNRVYLYPADVRGYFKKMRQHVHVLMIAIFLSVPWIHWNGQQIVKLDIAHRRFTFFGFHFWAHDVPMVFFFLITFTLLIAFITAVWGRAWCGWACPQTVFVEGIYRKIERWIEGPARVRKELDASPWNENKIYKKSIKFLLFLAVSLIITHSFLAYFVGSKELIQMITSSPSSNWPSFLVILFTTVVVWFDFGWFREQFCVIMCPYGRFQSVLMDDNSLVVAYNAKRGEPRRNHTKLNEGHGDCVNCMRCVQVCPTGIDIRRGVQMECIACTACIDACNEVMIKTKRAENLIGYTSLNKLAGKREKKITTRTILYAAALLLALFAFIFILSKKEMLETTLLRAKEIPYQIIPTEGKTLIINHFKLDVANQYDEDTNIAVSIPTEKYAEGYELIIAENPTVLKKNEQKKIDIFIRFNEKNLINGAAKLNLQINSPKWEKQKTLEASLVGPSH